MGANTISTAWHLHGVGEEPSRTLLWSSVHRGISMNTYPYRASVSCICPSGHRWRADLPGREILRKLRSSFLFTTHRTMSVDGGVTYISDSSIG
jgi:hypothetical protein